jgi:anti-sigma B factor antagonist
MAASIGGEVEARGNGVAVIRFENRIDLLTAPEVRQLLTNAVTSGHRRLVVDLGDVSFMDSSGLGALISGLKATRQAGGDLRIARPNTQVETALKLTSLDRVLTIYRSVEEALTGYG